MLKRLRFNISLPSPLEDSHKENSLIKTSAGSVYTAQQMSKMAASYAAKGQKRDFGVDIVAEIKNHPDDLWVLVRAIDANVPNDNGDFFADEELLKVVEVGGKSMPAYKTFEGCPVFSNHENDDVEKARGKVVHARWVEKTSKTGETEKYVECLLRIDREAYPALARGVEKDYICEVSMGCSVDKSICSICGNIAENQDDYCTHIKNYKTRKYSGPVDMKDGIKRMANSEDVYEINKGIKFIEISWVADGACENCKKIGVIDVDSVLDEVGQTLDKAAQHMSGSIIKMQSYIDDISSEEEDCNYNISELIDIEEFTKSCGHIVAEVQSIIEPLNILYSQNSLSKEVIAELNKNAAQEDIDRLRAALAVMEDVARVILARKENINLERLEELAGVMADLQDVVEKLVDEGFGSVSVADMYPGSNMEPMPEGVGSGQTVTGVGSITQPQMPTQANSPQAYANPTVNPGEANVGNIPSGQLPIATSSDEGNFKHAQSYEDNINKIKEFSARLKNVNKQEQGCDTMISKREEETFDFSQKLQTILAERIKGKQKPASSIKLAVHADEEDGVYSIELGEKSFVGYYNGEEVQSWKIDELDDEIKQELYENPEKVASKILVQFTQVFQNEGGGELMSDKKTNEKIADKANENINHDITEEAMLEDSRVYAPIEHKTEEEQMEDARNTEYSDSVKAKTSEGNLEGQSARDEAFSDSVKDKTVEKQQVSQRDSDVSDSVAGKTIERQMADNKTENAKSPLLEKNLGDKRIDDNVESYPGYTSQDGPSGPGWGKDDMPVGKGLGKSALSEVNFQVTAQLSKDLVETFTDIVLSSETPPNIVIAKTKEILSSDDSVGLIQKYASQERIEEREKADFFKKPVVLSDKILDGLAILASNYNVTEDSLKEFVEVILSDKKAEAIIAAHAQNRVGRTQEDPQTKQVVSKEASYRMSFRSVFAEELSPTEIDPGEVTAVKGILSSMVSEDCSPEDVFEAAKVVAGDSGLTFVLEEGVQPVAIKDRKQRIARMAWRVAIGKQASVDLNQQIIDKIADYIVEEGKDPEVVAAAVKQLVQEPNLIEDIKQSALDKLNEEEVEDTDIVEEVDMEEVVDEIGEEENTEEEEVNLVVAMIEEVGDVEDEDFSKKAKQVLMSVLIDENGIDAESVEIGEPQIEGDSVYAAFALKNGLEVKAQFNPGMMGGGMGGGMFGGGAPQAMPTAAPQMPQAAPGATVPPAPGVNPPNIPTEGGLGDFDFGMEGDVAPETMDSPAPEGELVPVELYIRLPQGNVPVQPGATPELPAGEMPGMGMPMMAVYKVPGNKILKTAQAMKICPACKSSNVDFENSVGYCNSCNTPFEVEIKRDKKNNELTACVEWIQPHELEEVSLTEIDDNSKADSWWS